jgi:two-component system sensor histidine kinase YesM
MKKLGIGKFRINKNFLRVIIGFCGLVLVPVIIFAQFFYKITYEEVVNTAIENRKVLIKHFGENLQVDLLATNSIFSIFKSNASLQNYLGGQYQTDVDQVSHFSQEIQPAFKSAYTTLPLIKKIRIYKINDDIMSLGNEIEDSKSLPVEVKKGLMKNSSVSGIWDISKSDKLNEAPIVRYYQTIFDHNYSKKLGYFEITFNNEQIKKIIGVNKGNINQQCLIMFKNKTVYQFGKDEFLIKKVAHETEDFIDNNEYKMIKNQVLIRENFDDLGVTSYFLIPIKQLVPNIQTLKVTFMGGIVVVLIFLSFIYYFSIWSLNKRVFQVAEHMNSLDISNPQLLTVKQKDDEVGVLVNTYNRLVNRVDYLMNNIYKAEIREKEAKNLMMQAQINPHFLYNTLEAIRMMAEMNDDNDVSDSMQTLSKLMRYSLSSSFHDSNLDHEIENIRDYLTIYKLRFMNKIQYEILITGESRMVNCPKCILQPILENSFKHGLEKKSGIGTVNILIKYEKNKVMIIFNDNGKGISDEKLSIIRKRMYSSEIDSQNIGLNNVYNRMKNFFQEKFSMRINSKINEGTQVIIQIYY